MRTATITTTSGHSWTTEVNGTDESICKYFLGQWFDVEPYPSERKERAEFVSLDRKLYSTLWPRHAREFHLYSSNLIGNTVWYLDVLSGDGAPTRCTIGIPNDRESGIRMYESFCPGRVVPLNFV